MSNLIINRSRLGVIGVVLGLIAGTAYAALDYWHGNLEVTIAAAKDTAAQRITYTITVKNKGDDDARDIVISHTPALALPLNGMSISSVSATNASCTHSLINTRRISVKCTLATLGVQGTETITVVANNPGNEARIGTAQAMGITPDSVPGNNNSSVSVP